MSSYPQGEVLLARCRAGLGKIVIVEGESVDQDPYIYGRWFGDLARELTFLPQNGCEKVVKAVAELRAQLAPLHEVYGIRDRDFCEDEVLDAQDRDIPADGVLRPRRYTLENYMLDPDVWFEVIKLVHRSTLPAGWDAVAEVESRVLDAYRSCLALAAWNFTVKQEYERLPADPTDARLGYKAHPNAMPTDPPAKLDEWGKKRGAPSLADAFTAELTRLQSATFTEWQRRVTGKAVLKTFQQSFPAAGARHNLLDNLYMDRCPEPPADLAHLVRKILSPTAR